MLRPVLKYEGFIDALLVLGRGIDLNGTLSPTGFERAEVAVDLARRLNPRTVVFSGSHSRLQALEGVVPPSEGGAMLAYASNFVDDVLRAHTEFLAEEASISTVANMVNSKPLLRLPKKSARLGILSDRLHFAFGRVEYLGGLVFPGVKIIPLLIDREETPESIREEKLTTFMTRLAMAGVRAGNDRAIMRRQHALESGNSAFWRAVRYLSSKQ